MRVCTSCDWLCCCFFAIDVELYLSCTNCHRRRRLIRLSTRTIDHINVCADKYRVPLTSKKKNKYGTKKKTSCRRVNFCDNILSLPGLNYGLVCFERYSLAVKLQSPQFDKSLNGTICRTENIFRIFNTYFASHIFLSLPIAVSAVLVQNQLRCPGNSIRGTLERRSGVVDLYRAYLAYGYLGGLSRHRPLLHSHAHTHIHPNTDDDGHDRSVCVVRLPGE